MTTSILCCITLLTFKGNGIKRVPLKLRFYVIAIGTVASNMKRMTDTVKSLSTYDDGIFVGTITFPME